MVYGGVRDVLVTNEVVGRQKLRRLTALAQNAQVGVCVDDLAQVHALETAAGEAGVTLPVYVEVNMGGNCGQLPDAVRYIDNRRAADQRARPLSVLLARDAANFHDPSTNHAIAWESSLICN